MFKESMAKENLHIESILKIARCPQCNTNSWSREQDSVKCNGCDCVFPVRGYSIDFVDKRQYSNLDPKELSIHKRALENWGKSLHAESMNQIPGEWHSSHFSEFFRDDDIYSGTILEIGCGAGIDSLITARTYPERPYYALDIGGNIPALSIRDNHLNNLHYIRGDSLNLPVEDDCIDSAISFGVFHHTLDPKKCMDEAFRVLKDNGSLCIYLYKNHEDNILKYIGVQAEKTLMYLTSRMSVRTGRAFCWCLSPVVLFLFSWPAQVLKRVKRFEKTGQSFPLHWGTVPSTIVDDLQDRLLASVNHRFSKKEFEALFSKSGFSKVEVVTTTAGHFGYGQKIA